MAALPLKSSSRGMNSGDSLFRSCSFLVRDSLDKSTVTEESVMDFSFSLFVSFEKNNIIMISIFSLLINLHNYNSKRRVV